MDFWTAAIMYCVLTLAPFLSYIFAPSPKPLRGIYHQRGRSHSIKYVVFWLMVTVRQLISKLGVKLSGSGYGAKSSDKLEELDGVHDLPPEYEQAVDAVYFVGVNQNGFGMLASAARRHKGLVQTSLELVVPDVGVLVHPRMPDTSVRIAKAEEKGQWHVGGLAITPIEAGRKWHIRCSGPMRLLPEGFEGPASEGATELVNVDFEGTWEATARVFDTDTDIHPHSICDSVARETWSREMFDTLEKQHQTHLEQFGEVKASVTIEGHGSYSPRIQVLRDHTFGRFRDWNEFHRYAIHYLFCDDGSGLTTAVLCRPVTMSRLTFGYRVYPDGNLTPVPSVSTELGKVDEDYTTKPGFSFTASGGGRFPMLWPEKYEVRIDKVFAAPAFFIGDDRDAKITDVFLKGTLNGRPCWGICEWMEGYHGKGSTRKQLYASEEEAD